MDDDLLYHSLQGSFLFLWLRLRHSKGGVTVVLTVGVPDPAPLAGDREEMIAVATITTAAGAGTVRTDVCSRCY
ncbi:hypothetical protein ACP70R_021880 [Stipagrostis hirtigluma subsp. patula]